MAHNDTKLIAAALVDRLGFIKAQIADLKQEEQRLSEELIDTGETAIDGSAYRAAISLVEPRKSIDWKTVAEKLNPYRQLLAANTKWSAGYVSVRVSARRVD